MPAEHAEARGMKIKKKPVNQMTAAELEALTADLDQEFIMDKFRPLTPAERAQWERAKRKLGRPLRQA